MCDADLSSADLLLAVCWQMHAYKLDLKLDDVVR